MQSRDRNSANLPVISAFLPNGGAEAALASLKMLRVEPVYISVMLGANKNPEPEAAQASILRALVNDLVTSNLYRRVMSAVLKLLNKIPATGIIGQNGLIILIVPVENKTLELVVRRTMRYHGAFEVSDPLVNVSVGQSTSNPVPIAHYGSTQASIL